MNSTAFQQLGIGVKFNLKRFGGDADRLQLFKKRKTEGNATKKVENLTESVELVDKKTENVETKSDDVKKSKKQKKVKSATVLAQLKREELNRFRKQHRIFVSGADIPDPCSSFAEMQKRYKIPERLMQNLQASRYEIPTAIQMQSVPLLLENRSLLACAPTGSGKTLAFVLPILTILEKKKLEKKLAEKFTCVVLEPTRELAAQVCREFVRLGDGLGFYFQRIRKTNVPSNKFALRTQSNLHVLITTPIRLVYLLSQNPPGIDLSCVEWLIIDESDKLFETGKRGFRIQLASIYQACTSPFVKRALFSATFSYDVEKWCKLNLDSVAQVCIGPKNKACESVEQSLIFVGNEYGKLVELRRMVTEGVSPPVLIFVQTKQRAKQLCRKLKADNLNADVIHSDRPQHERDDVVDSFRSGKIWFLICTELLGRGIDFKGVSLVINYDFPASPISYIHRIGRTGRAGRQGKAVTLFTENDGHLLKTMANVMHQAGCPIPNYLLQKNGQGKKRRRSNPITQPAAKKP